MPTETLTTNGRVEIAQPPLISVEQESERALREFALDELKRIRALKMHVVTWAVGIPFLGVIWVLTEYFQDNQWPTRFADADNGISTTWNPWFFWAAGVWTAVLVFHGVRTYALTRLRPPTSADVDREVERLKTRG